MKKTLLAVALCGTTAAVAGPEKIQFPSSYLKGVLYQTLDRPEGNVIVFQGHDMVEVSKFFEAISNIRIP